jgi:hypothetical protein
MSISNGLSVGYIVQVYTSFSAALSSLAASVPHMTGFNAQSGVITVPMYIDSHELKHPMKC